MTGEHLSLIVITQFLERTLAPLLVVWHCVFARWTRRPVTAGATWDPVTGVCAFNFKRELCGHSCCGTTVLTATLVCGGREGDRASGRGLGLQGGMHVRIMHQFTPRSHLLSTQGVYGRAFT